MVGTEKSAEINTFQRITFLQDQLKAREAEVVSRDHEIEKLIEIIRLLKHQHFGRSSEKDKSPDQLGLFNEVEQTAKSGEEEEENTVVVPEHERKIPKRKPLPEDLPREDRVIVVAEKDRICPNDGHVMEEMGEEVSEKLDVIPMILKVIRTVRKKYACRHCAEGVKTAPVPVQAIPKSIASEGLLASITNWKYTDAFPLYRIENMFARHGVDISRGTMAHWMIKSGILVQPLINLLSEDLLSGNYLQMDETRVQVLKEHGKRAESLSYMWVRALPGPDPIILFDYDPTRSGAVPMRLLEGFTGHLQVDGYEGYNKVTTQPGMTRGGCFAHCRRKYFEASQVVKKIGLANQGIKLIKKLYRIEDMWDGKSYEKRYELRQTLAKPVLAEIEMWVEEKIRLVPPKMAIGKAFAYTKNEWQYLIRYIDDGRYEIDNNFVENKIRPFALGRKNWLFSDSVDGALASGNLYSLVTTAKANGLEPQKYLRLVFELLPAARTIEDVQRLLPANVKKNSLI